MKNCGGRHINNLSAFIAVYRLVQAVVGAGEFGPPPDLCTAVSV